MPTYSNRPNPWSTTLHPHEVLGDRKPLGPMPDTTLVRCPECRRRRSRNQYRSDPRDARSGVETVCYECKRGAK